MESPEPAGPPLSEGALKAVSEVDTESPSEVLRCIRIVPGGRYAIIVPDAMVKEAVEGLIYNLSEWLKSGQPFIILKGVKLVRVDEEEPDDSAHRG